MLKLRLEEIIVVACFTVLHLSLYHYTAHLPRPKIKAAPIQIKFIHPKPIPIPEPKVEEPKPRLIDAPPKPKDPPKKLPKSPKPKLKPKKVVKKPEVKKVVFKPRLQQQSIVKVHAEEVVIKEVVEHAQPISEPVVKKPDPKPEPKEEREDPPEPPAPKHVPVITKTTASSSCRSTLDNYPSQAREEGLEGTVKVKVTVSASGNVTGASIVKSSGHDILDQSVLSNVYDCNFEPAEKDGVPISSKVVIPVLFKLN
jgi:protein TonB